MMPRAFPLFLACFLGTALPVVAQPSVSSSAARTAQFVFIIDDSGSMKRTDPDRMAIFAAQSLVSMLDDQDEVSVVRLNGPHDGAEPLRRNRSQVLGLLGLDKTLAGYGADETRCRSALDAVQRLLNEAYRPEVAQVVIFLTDGECTPAGQEQPDTEGFLGGLKSQKDKLFQFYLLLFRGDDLASWIGLLVVVQNVVSSLFNSHLFDFHEGWMYVIGVGVAGGMVIRAQQAEAKAAEAGS